MKYNMVLFIGLAVSSFIGCGHTQEPQVPQVVYIEPTPPGTAYPMVQQPPVVVQQQISEDHPCWDAVKERASDWYNVGKDWMHDATAPDCKARPDARGCK